MFLPTDHNIIPKPNEPLNVQVSKSPLQWQVTYEATDEAGNYAEPRVRTIEIQASVTVAQATRFWVG